MFWNAWSQVRPELIRMVDLGPFKHKIDDGLDLRKVSFECMNMLLDTCRGALDSGLVLQHLEAGLGDEPDVKGPCHVLLVKLAAQQGELVVAALERLLVPMETTLTTRLKADAVKQVRRRRQPKRVAWIS